MMLKSHWAFLYCFFIIIIMASTSDDLGYLICVLPNFSTSIVEEIFDNNSAFEDWMKENPSYYANFKSGLNYHPTHTLSWCYLLQVYYYTFWLGFSYKTTVYLTFSFSFSIIGESNECLEEFYNAIIFDKSSFFFFIFLTHFWLPNHLSKQDACSSSPLDEHHDTNHCSSSLRMNNIDLGSHARWRKQCITICLTYFFSFFL